MTVDPTVLPGLLLLAAELAILAAVGFVVVRVALRQADARMALAQGLLVGPALWGLIVNFIMHAIPGLGGASVGWAVVLAIGAGLVWRTSQPIWPRPRVAAGFILVVLALLWVALASRQILSVSDPQIQLGHAAAIRAGEFPPGLPWSPGLSAPYHYGASLQVGLLLPPFGPDLAFVWELVGAYTWVSFVLIVVTLLLRRASGFAVLVTSPLLLTAGLWTYSNVGGGLLHVPIPVGLPTAGLRASLADIYWPLASYEVVPDMRHAALADIWNHSFPMAYALVVVVLERAAHAESRSWPAAVTLAILVGFTGLLSITLGPVLLVLWAVLEATGLVELRRAGSALRRPALQSGMRLALAALLLMLGGIESAAGFLDDSMPSSLALTWNPALGIYPPLESIDLRSGGVGLVAAGPIVVTGVAALLARRDRLVVALAVGAGALVLAWLVLNYAPEPRTLNRLAGHARNFALVALLLALSSGLTRLQPRWRYAAAALVAGLVVWPTVVAPARYLGQAIGRGITVANAEPGEGPGGRYGGRYLLDPGPSDPIAAYIRDHTAIDARVLSANPNRMTYATGRPNAAGFVGLLHYISFHGPEYLDALRYLEPAAIRRLGTGYVHATDAWVDSLPDQAKQWLNDPHLFELLVRDTTEALFRVRPAFLELATAPAHGSFEVLRRAVPASATLYVPSKLQKLGSMRAARVLSHAQLLGSINPAVLFLRTPWPSQPLADQVPDLVILPLSIEPRMFPPAGQQPVWWSTSDGIAVYAPTRAVQPVMPPPPDAEPPPEPMPVSITVSEVRTADGSIAFTLALEDLASEQWTGHDWVLNAGEPSRWAIPIELQPDGRTPVVARWFAGQTAPGRGTTTRQFTFDARTSQLVVRESGQETVVAASGDGVGEGIWMLTLRLLRAEDRGTYVAQEVVAFIPVLQIEILESGEASTHVYETVDRG